MTKTSFSAALICLVSTSIMAEGAAIDPADVTKVYTQSALMLNGSSQLQWQGQIAGGLDNGQQFALLSEATFDNKDNDPNKFGVDYQYSRTQYFHVFDTGLGVTPKLGASLDYVNTRTNTVKNDLLSVGAVAAINPSITKGLLVFPRVGYVTGNMEIEQFSQRAETLHGYSLALITAKHIGENGAYLSVVPEWQDLSGDDIDTQTLSIKTSINVPLNQSRSWWLNTRFDVNQSKTLFNEMTVIDEWQTQAWIGVRRYF